MLENKQVWSVQRFGDNNVYNKAQYNYNSPGVSFINCTKMRFDLKGMMSDVIS